MSARRTYWHLEGLKRAPTDYEITSSRLLYHPTKGFEVDVPLAEWYRRHVKNSPFVLADAERFSDPRETTYASYTRLQKDQEQQAQDFLDAMEAPDYDRALPAGWITLLSRTLAPLRYPLHAMQMMAAYVGQSAPGGKIVIAALFQAADEMRRVQRIAYRMAQIQQTRPAFGRDSREIWERDPQWQPMRKLVERMLVTYDWAEALVALNVVLKPLFDELFMVQFGGVAAQSGDPLLGRVLLSLNADCLWHRDWTRTLLKLAVDERPENQGSCAAGSAAGTAKRFPRSPPSAPSSKRAARPWARASRASWPASTSCAGNTGRPRTVVVDGVSDR